MAIRQRVLRAGLISDTHGLLRPQALDALRGSELIVHAGDIGDPSILEALARIAPVAAVRGNNDRAGWANDIPEHRVAEIGGMRMYVLHDRHDLARYPVPAGCEVVVTGHSHKPLVERLDGVLYVNPGSAGPRRFRLPITVARLTIAKSIEASIVELAV